MNELTIEYVWCPSRKEFNKLIRKIDKDSTKVIDYVAIKNKLMKSDPYGESPSDSVIGLNIINGITRALLPSNDGITRVIYLLKNLEIDPVSNFKNLIDSKTNRDISMILTVIHNKVTPPTELNNVFDSVNIITK